jgi:AcrR family transcriptional regulator
MSRVSSPRRTATRLRLYEAAVALVAEQGFAATTVEEIAERAGVAKGTVYYNFGGKTEFFEELLKHSSGLFTAALRAAADQARAGGGGPLAALDAIVRAGLAFVGDQPALIQLYATELWRPHPADRARAWHESLARARCQALGVIEEALREAADAGELDARSEPALTAAGLMGMMLVTALDWRMFQPQRSLDEVHAALAPLLPRPAPTARNGQP